MLPLPNLYGDVVSDSRAWTGGGLGLSYERKHWRWMCAVRGRPWHGAGYRRKGIANRRQCDCWRDDAKLLTEDRCRPRRILVLSTKVYREGTHTTRDVGFFLAPCYGQHPGIYEGSDWRIGRENESHWRCQHRRFTVLGKSPS